MKPVTRSDMFERELTKLHHAELEILDLHGDLAEAVASDEVIALFTDHEADTVEQIHRIEQIFDELGEEPESVGSPVTEGILAEKDGNRPDKCGVSAPRPGRVEYGDPERTVRNHSSRPTVAVDDGSGCAR